MKIPWSSALALAAVLALAACSKKGPPPEETPPTPSSRTPWVKARSSEGVPLLEAPAPTPGRQGGYGSMLTSQTMRSIGSARSGHASVVGAKSSFMPPNRKPSVIETKGTPNARPVRRARCTQPTLMMRPL